MDRFKEEVGIILDTKTGLEWRKDYAKNLIWDQAVEYADKLGVGWRLPTIEELITLINFGRINPASDFPEIHSDWYWSSSRAASTSNAWYVNFNNGHVFYSVKTNDNYARCVRDRKEG